MKSKIKDTKNLNLLGSAELLKELINRIESGKITTLYEEINNVHIGSSAIYGLKFGSYEVNLDDADANAERGEDEGKEIKVDYKKYEKCKDCERIGKKSIKTEDNCNKLTGDVVELIFEEEKRGKTQAKAKKILEKVSEHKTISLKESLKHTLPYKKDKNKVVCKECDKICVKNRFFAHYKAHL